MTDQIDIEALNLFDFARLCRLTYQRLVDALDSDEERRQIVAATSALKEAARRLAIIAASDEPEKVKEFELSQANAKRVTEKLQETIHQVEKQRSDQVSLLEREILLLRELLKWKDTALIAVASSSPELASTAAMNANAALERLRDLGTPVP